MRSNYADDEHKNCCSNIFIFTFVRTTRTMSCSEISEEVPITIDRCKSWPTHVRVFIADSSLFFGKILTQSTLKMDTGICWSSAKHDSALNNSLMLCVRDQCKYKFMTVGYSSNLNGRSLPWHLRRKENLIRFL